MPRLRYHVAMSLDGFIAGPNGEYDWITPDPAIDFAALFAEFDTFVMGRKTYEVFCKDVPSDFKTGKKVVVASRTLKPEEHPGATILCEGVKEAVAQLKQKPGKDIWLFGGGVLFRALLDAGLVDLIEVAVIPIMLGDGIPVLPAGKHSPPLKLVKPKIYPSGIVMLSYEIAGAAS